MSKFTNVDFADVVFDGSRFTNASFRHAVFDHANFSGVDLSSIVMDSETKLPSSLLKNPEI